jgi:HD-GYP domain-containing protein (c-di-GMP phosphodiesterase class II)
MFHHLGGVELGVAMARKWSGGAFDPELVERFCMDPGRYYGTWEVEPTWNAVLAAEPEPIHRLSADQIDGGIEVIAHFVDLNMSYTIGHSTGVAGLAAAAAQQSGLPAVDVTSARRAAYLHDLGRVGIPIRIWVKPGALTDAEWDRVRLHPYFTERLLARSQPLAALATVAAGHHERLDGSGYHRALPAAMLSPLARILAAADAYHAMTEPRPHRAAMAPEPAAEALRAEVRAGRLDSEAANAVLRAAGHRVSAVRRSWVAGLTDREVEVLRLLARGLPNRSIAQRLTITPVTAGHHVQHIYDKIGVSTRAAATLFAMQHNLFNEYQ